VLKFANSRNVEVCPDAFAKAHYRGHTYYDKLVAELKKGAVDGSGTLFSKHSAIKPSDVRHIIKNNASGLELTTSQFTAATLPNTLRAMFTAAWMKEFFRLTGMSVQYTFCFIREGVGYFLTFI
jgi:hypothetical protein